MALSFIQWEKYIQGFPDDRLGKEFQDPGSTVAGPEKPPQAIVITEMGSRNAAREADAAVQANQNQPNGTIVALLLAVLVGLLLVVDPPVAPVAPLLAVPRWVLVVLPLVVLPLVVPR